MELINDSKMLSKHLLRCLHDYAHFAFATAWASADTDVFRAIRHNIDRLHHGVIGIHFFQTDPDVLDAFVDSDKVRFMLQPNGTFHPKTLIFWEGVRWELFVGSANLTRGGLSTNAEVTLRTTGRSHDEAPPRYMAVDTIDTWFRGAKKMTEEKARHYRAAQPTRQAALQRLAGIYEAAPRKNMLDSPVMTYDWADFLHAVVHEAGKNLSPRLELLRAVRAAFAGSGTFEAMSRETRMMVAGMPGGSGLNAGWFGSMGAARRFWTALEHHVPTLSEALDRIPAGGDVTQSEYEGYIELFLKAFPEGGGGIGTATRLLAMKRPDQFVCLDTANRRKLGRDLGVVTSSMPFDRYWSSVIERLRDTAWWQAPPPADPHDHEIWRGRVALLDALFYEDPPSK